MTQVKSLYISNSNVIGLVARFQYAFSAATDQKSAQFIEVVN